MEKVYEYDEFDKLMNKYNFDLPIEITLVVEEEEPPEPVLLKTLLDSNNINVPNSIFCPNNSEVYKRRDSNVDDPKTKKKNCNSQSVVQEKNLSIPVINTDFPERHQVKIQGIEWKLLDSVADNLIHITKYHYYNFVNINVKMANYERLKIEYLTIKHSFFNLSYTTTIAILLPRENDILFINDFIHRVITIANRISWFQITYKTLEILIHEMLVWTKQKKIKLDTELDSHNHERGGMDLSSSGLAISNRLNHSSQVLNRPFDNGSTTNHLTQGTNRHLDNVHKTYPPEHVKNMSPHIRPITNYSTKELSRLLNISPRIHYPLEGIDNATSNRNIQDNAVPKITKKLHNNCSTTFHSQPELNISPSLAQRTIHSNQETSSPILILNTDRRINNSMQGMSRLPFVDSRINQSTETITSIYNNDPKTNNVSRREAININANINERHVNVAYGTKSTKRPKTNNGSYSPYKNIKTMTHHNDKIFNNKKNNSSATTFKSPVDGLCHEDSRKAEYELFNAETLRSSISRDSGFGSPIYGSFRNEQTIETGEEQETPFISNVISMNPNAIHLNIGFCKFCGATTINMCIGCYREYYCSFSCQTKDLENHKYLCSG